MGGGVGGRGGGILMKPNGGELLGPRRRIKANAQQMNRLRVTAVLLAGHRMGMGRQQRTD